MAKAPALKTIKAEIDAAKTDLKNLEGAYAQIQAAIDAADYFGAKDTATSIKDRATAISDRVNMVIAKATGKK